jgi:acyl-CoA synthetase (AMP-forming)/AMP-acid ligase II
VKQIIHPDGDVFTPYGSTESLPVACNSATEVLGETAERTRNGEGTCVGQRFPDICWRLIKITDEPVLNIEESQLVEPGEIGELIVQGAVVTDQYVTRIEANRFHKIADGDQFWHRMGDVGYFDKQERFWFCGRKSHRVLAEFGTLFTIPCEGIFNQHPQVYRTALVGVGSAGNQTPVLIAEPHRADWRQDQSKATQLLTELRDLGKQYWQTERIEHFLLHPALPVDIRHNSKIFREKLRDWAREKLGDAVQMTGARSES